MVIRERKVTERVIQEQIMDGLNQIPRVKVWKFYAGGIRFEDRFIPQNKAGVSDIIGCYKGRFIAIEVKVPGNKPTLLQLNFIQNIKDCGGIAFVACSPEDVIREIKNQNGGVL